MSDEIQQPHQLTPYQESPLQAWEDQRQPAPAIPQSPLERPLAAIRRYKWLLFAIVILATGGGVAATRFLTPQYEVRARILISSDSPMESRTGPIRSSGVLAADDWAALFKTGTVADAVVRQLALYVEPADKANAPLFKGFDLADQYKSGQYQLLIDRTGKRWTLAKEPSGESEKGTMLDSVGRRFGFLWMPPKLAFAGVGDNKIVFTVSTPRETAARLADRLVPQRRDESNFLILTLQDPNPELAANILNTWSREFVSAASRLKKRKLSEFASTLDGQLHTAKASLESTEVQLSTFKVNTITEPTDRGPIAAGLQETRDPVMKDYFDKKIEFADIGLDIRQLRAAIASMKRDSVPTEALLQIRSVATSPAAQALRGALADYHAAQSKLDTLRIPYTDENVLVKNVITQLTMLRTRTIPSDANQLLLSLEGRAADDSVRIAGASENLKQIPERTIEEERLLRNRNVAAGIYMNLSNRAAEAQLAESSATPDVMILDSAVAPLSPTKNTAPRVVLMAILVGIGGAIALALLLDRMDSKLRYPEQATDELGLAIAGTVPRFPKGGIDQNSPEQMFQLVESFRSLRMSVVSASGGGPVSIAVSSPSPSEGKSLISANLAMSFADAGLRTVLVDGDTRRGALHEMFDLAVKPGLTDYLAGAATLGEVIRPAAHEALCVIPCGTRKRRSPELLTSNRLPALVAELRSMFDVVVFDTPPLAAGIDGYSIATATGNLLVVLRVGKTMRRLAAEKLRMFERLPVNVVGAVLNGIGLDGAYGYYGYVPGYAAEDESDRTDVVHIP